MMALTLALVGETVDQEKTGSAMGLLATLSAVGTALGPSFGGMLISGFGWPALFLVNIPLGLLTLGLAWYSLPVREVPLKPEGVRFDVTGTLLLAMTLAAYALAMTSEHGNFGGLNLALLLIALVGGGLFIRAQSRAVSPLIPLAVFRDKQLVSGLATSALVATVLMATLLVGPFTCPSPSDCRRPSWGWRWPRGRPSRRWPECLPDAWRIASACSPCGSPAWQPWSSAA